MDTEPDLFERWLRLWPHTLLLALIVGIAAGGVLGWWSPLVAGLAVLAAALGLVLGRRRPGAALATLAVAIAAAGWAWGGARAEATAPAPLETTGEVDGLVTLLEAPRPSARGLRARAEVGHLEVDGRVALPGGARVLLGLAPDRERLREGERVRVTGALAPAADESAPGWWRRWLARNGISGRVEVETADAVGRRGGLWGARDRWREWAREHAGAGLSGDTGALVRGMLLGGGSELSETAGEEFREAGIWHLLAVSGQNVTVVAVAVLAALRALLVPRRTALVAAGIAVVAYCLACEGGPSVARAGLMGGLGLSVGFAGLPRQRWYLLLLALAGVLAVRPRGVSDPGLQLSFAAVAGLFSIAPLLADRFGDVIPRRIAELVATSIAAGVATAPVLAWHFGHLSLVGLGLNVVAVPLAAPVVVLALVSLAAVPLGALATLPAALAGLGADALLVGARLAASVPGASVSVPPWSALGLALLAVALLVGLAIADRRGWTAGPRVLGSLAFGAIAVGVLAGASLWAQSAESATGRGGRTFLSVLDVGQGQALLVRDESGRAALLDAGPPGTPAPVVDELTEHGIERLEAVVLSHDALDHSGGLSDVLAAIPTERVLVPASAPDALAEARSHGVSVGTISQGDEIALGESTLRVLWPRGGFASQEPNDASAVVELRAEGLSALVPGDAESPILARLALAPVDVFVVAHHGSADGGLATVLARLDPQVAVVSAGAGNRHGHPAAGTVAAIETAGVRLARTDRDGTVTVLPRGPRPRPLAAGG